jgi:hypothetical protein
MVVDSSIAIIGIGCFFVAATFFFINGQFYSDQKKSLFVGGNIFLHWFLVFISTGMMLSHGVSITISALVAVAISSGFVIITILMYRSAYEKKHAIKICA